MRVISCIVENHSLLVVFLAAIMCLVGSSVTLGLFRRALSTTGLNRHGWHFLTAVCAGSAIWSTHFIAMLGYQPPVPVTFDPVLTVISAIIAIAGTGIGFAISTSDWRRATVVGGGIIGISIAAMHYGGMFAYKVEGIVTWDEAYLLASIGLSVTLSIGCVAAAKRSSAGHLRHGATALLVTAIVGLHFTGIAAFQVSPIPGFDSGVHSEAFQAMALSILVVGLIIVGTGISSYLIDDRTRATSTAQLEHMAFNDPLTGLANRRSLGDHMAKALAAQRRFQLLLIDLDRFKNVNDSFGHAIGDKLLVEAAIRIRGLIDDGAVAARIGGDEMAVMLFADDVVAASIADDIVARIAEPFSVDDHAVLIGCSIGLCSTAYADTAETLMQRADIALYEAKRKGRNRSFRYESGMLEAVAQRNRFEADLREAVRRGEFRLEYQPIIDAGKGRTIGYEALIRWDCPSRGLVSPADFIPLAEDCGIIVAIGGWVLEEACRQAMRWAPGLTVAVNVSAVQFRSPLLLAQVTRALSLSGLPASRLEIELTETAIVSDSPYVAHTLSALRILGIKIAMDDFGTGYSSLAHLRDLPLDRIKIDRSFVATAATDRNSMAVLKAITQLGRDMGIPTLGEGVETQEQLTMLQALGCDALQGFFIGRPMRGTATTELRRDTAWA